MLSNRNQSYLHQIFKQKMYESEGPDFTRFCSDLFVLAWPSFLTGDPAESASVSTGFDPERRTCFRFYTPTDLSAEEPFAEAADILKEDCSDLASHFPGCEPILHYVFCINTKQRKSIPHLLEEAAKQQRELCASQNFTIQIYTTQALRDFFWSDSLTDEQRIGFLGNPELFDDPEPVLTSEPAIRCPRLSLKAPVPLLSDRFLPDSRKEELLRLMNGVRKEHAFWLCGPEGIGLHSLAIAYANLRESAALQIAWISSRDLLKMALSERTNLTEQVLLILDTCPDTTGEGTWDLNGEMIRDYLTLPCQKLILTRSQADCSDSSLLVGPLSPEFQILLLRQYLPASEELSEFELKREAHQLSDLTELLQGHTLSLHLAGKLLASSGTSYGLDELLHTLTADADESLDDPILSNLRLLYQAFDFSSAEQDVLLHASGFGPGGLEQGLFYGSETDEGKAAIFTLTAKGWLTQHAEEALTLHPMLKELCRSLSIPQEEPAGLIRPLIGLLRKLNKNWFPEKKKPSEPVQEIFQDQLYDQILMRLTSQEALSRNTLLNSADIFAIAADRSVQTSGQTSRQTNLFRAAYLYYLGGSVSKACDYQSRAVALLPEGSEVQNPEPYLYQIRYLIQNGKAAEAHTLLLPLMEQSSLWSTDHQLFLLELGSQIACDLQDTGLLTNCAKKRASLLNAESQTTLRDQLNAQLELGCSELLQNRQEEAIACLEHLFFLLDQFSVTADPEDKSQIFSQPASVHTLAEPGSEGPALFRRAERIMADKLSVRSIYEALPALARGFHFLDCGDYQEALQSLQLSADRMKQNGYASRPLYALLLADLGWLYGILSRPERGIAALEEVLKLSEGQDPEYAYSLKTYAAYQLGFLYRALGDYTNAAQHLEAYEDLTNPPTPVELDDPEEPALLLRKADEVCFTLGSVYCSNGDYDKAIEFLSLALETGNLSAYYWLGIAYTNTWQYNQAILTYQEGLDLAEKSASPDPQHQTETAWLYSGYGYTLSISEREPELGLEYSQKAHAIFQAQFEADSTTLALSYYRVGLGYAACDRKEEARREFDQALQILENHPDYKNQYASWIREIRDTRIRFY